MLGTLAQQPRRDDPLAVTDNGRDPTAMARKVKADETAGVLALWILKGCQAKKPC